MKINNLFEDRGPNDAGVRYWIALWKRAHNIEDMNVYSENDVIAAIREYILTARKKTERELEMCGPKGIQQSDDPFSDVEDEPEQMPPYSVTIRVYMKAGAGAPHHLNNPVKLVAGLTINYWCNGAITAADDMAHDVFRDGGTAVNWAHPLLQPIVTLLREMNVELT